MGKETELQRIEDLWVEHFDDPWSVRVDRFNDMLQLNDGDRFLLPNSRCSPAWVNGDVQRMKPGEWVLVVSLNPHVDAVNNKLEDVDIESGIQWRQFWKSFNMRREHWKGDFFPQLSQLASSCLSYDLTGDKVLNFAYDSMIFIEFCPYASTTFPGSVSWNGWKRVANTDSAMHISNYVRRLLFDFGEPALVLCNGKFAAWDVKDQQFSVTGMQPIDVLSARGSPVTIYPDVYEPPVGKKFRVLGFNQIGRRNSSSTDEIQTIARFAQQWE